MNTTECTSPASTSETPFDPYYSEILVPAAAGDSVAMQQVLTARRHVLNERTVAATTNLTVYGDEVVVEGVITLPGRQVTIVCRRLEFLPDPLNPGNYGGIDVSGCRGKDGCSGGQTTAGTEPMAATAGQDGQPGRHEGGVGSNGQPGGDGGKGGEGGSITIWCDRLVRGPQLVLDASGGLGGNGGKGQPGGRGGNGIDNLDDNDSESARGGAGGCGGHGGNGGAGGDGGTISLNFLGFDFPMSGMSLSVAGGIGGNGASPGIGGNGGNGGTPKMDSLRYKPNFLAFMGGRDPDGHQNGADSGGGGVCGLPGYGGVAGSPGTIAIGALRPPAVPSVDPKTYQIIRVEAEQTAFEGTIANIWAVWTRAKVWGSWNEIHTPIDANGADGQALPAEQTFGKAGTPGGPAPVDPRYGAVNGGLDIRGRGFGPGQSGQVGANNANRPAQGARPVATPPTRVGISPASNYPGCWSIVDDRSLALQLSGDLLPMVFERCRERFLFTNVHANTNETREAVGSLQATLSWIVRMATERKEADLAAAATMTLESLRQGRNLFGHDHDFVALGSIDRYQPDLTEVVAEYSAIEQTHGALAGALKNAQERAGFLGNLSGSQSRTLTALEADVADSVAKVNAALTSVQQFEANRAEGSVHLIKKFTDFENEVTLGTGLTPAALLSAIGQLAFINPEAPAFAIPLVASQAGDLISKTANEIATDNGTTVNRSYLSRQVLSLSNEVTDFTGLKQASDGLISADGTEQGRLMATRRQVDAICAEFFSKCPTAKKLSDDLAHYIELVATRNAKIAEYNDALTELCYLRSQADAIRSAKNKTESWRVSQAGLSLPQMAAFSSALWRHAREQCVETLYLASRAFTMHTLSNKDVFVDVLRQLMAGSQRPDNINSTAFRAALIDFIVGRLKEENKRLSTIQAFVPMGNSCRIEFTKARNPLLFATLMNGNEGLVSILPARKDTNTDHTHFPGMANVRLSAIRACALGMRTKDNIHVIQFTHPGVETIVTASDVPVTVNHQKVHHEYRYDARALSPDGTTISAGAAAAARPETGTVTSAPAATPAPVLTGGFLDAQRQMIGPFCQWSIRIPREYNSELDLSGLRSIIIEFEGTYQSFA